MKLTSHRCEGQDARPADAGWAADGSDARRFAEAIAAEEGAMATGHLGL